jgi:hypothetical protein
MRLKRPEGPHGVVVGKQNNPSLPGTEPPAKVRAVVNDDQFRRGPEVLLSEGRDQVRALGDSIRNGRR